MAYTAIDDPSAYFQTITWTGNGSDPRTITFDGNSDMQPNWVWEKSTNLAYQHNLYDSVRGGGKGLVTNNDAIEVSDNANGYISAFTSDGFVLTAGSTNNELLNEDTTTYVGWGWKAGTSVSGNTSGSGTAKAYTGSVNTDAGFSIIRHLGNDTAGHTIPHHLGAVPKMIIGHGISGDDATSWTVYHHALGNTNTISLNETAAVSDSSVWNDTTPTSSVISLGSSGNVNDNDDAFILYSFAEKQGYSKFGSYLANSDSSNFLYTGFKPAFLIVKQTDGGGGNMNWGMFDNKRPGFNSQNGFLYANTAGAEDTSNATSIDLLSNGFQLRANTVGSNPGKSYIYMAFAEQPLVTSTGVPATAR